MNRNKIIIENCPNFYKIINFDYFEGDYFTINLINVYRKYIFQVDEINEENLAKIRKVDMILARYIDDYVFRKEMKYELLQVDIKQKSSNLLENLINSLIGVFEKFEEGQTRSIYIACWI